MGGKSFTLDDSYLEIAFRIGKDSGTGSLVTIFLFFVSIFGTSIGTDAKRNSLDIKNSIDMKK